MNWEYVSGFFDADGYVTFVRNKSNQERTPCIGFTNNEKYILQQIQSFIYSELGIKGFISGKKEPHKSINTNYDLKYMYLPKILLLIRKIHTKHKKKLHRFFLINTKLQLLTPRNGKYSEKMLLKRQQFEKEFFGN